MSASVRAICRRNVQPQSGMNLGGVDKEAQNLDVVRVQANDDLIQS